MELAAHIDAGSDTSSPLNVQKRIDVLSNHLDLRNLRVLDAGCGAGGYVEHLCSRGAQAEGIESEKDKVDQWLRAHPGDPRVKLGDIGRIDHPDDTFDAVLLNEVLEHVPDQDQALREIYRVLRPGGLLFLFSPNRFHPFETHGFVSKKTGQGTGVLKTFLLPYLPVGVLSPWLAPWARNYWPGELRTIVRGHGFKILRRGFVWQTLENSSGGQLPRHLGRLVPLMREAFKIAERIPLVKILGVSQLIVAQRPSGGIVR
jgi:SAM-dependent methyltransferase